MNYKDAIIALLAKVTDEKLSAASGGCSRPRTADSEARYDLACDQHSDGCPPARELRANLLTRFGGSFVGLAVV